MITDAPIVFLDSGKGGLPYLLAYRERTRLHKLIYVADTASFPYGVKDGTELRQILRRALEKIAMRFNPSLIVLACNTASVTALKWLRRHFTIPLVGVVPAVKLAALHKSGGNIGLLVTERTATGEYLHDLIGQFAHNRVVVTVAAGDMVQYIEREATSLTMHAGSGALNGIVAAALDEFKRADVSVVVLGCTHFIYILDLLRANSEKKLTIIDSRAGVVNRISDLMREISPPIERGHAAHPHTTECYTTGDLLSHSFSTLLIECSIEYCGTL